MARLPDLSSGWRSYEVYRKDATTESAQSPFSYALKTSGTMLAQAINKISIVQEIGWPEARKHLKDASGQHLIAQKDDVIWLLKCKPSCWRLYFYVNNDRSNKQIVYVHAVCKKKDKEDDGEARKARSIADEILSGRSSITLFEFPAF